MEGPLPTHTYSYSCHHHIHIFMSSSYSCHQHLHFHLHFHIIFSTKSPPPTLSIIVSISLRGIIVSISLGGDCIPRCLNASRRRSQDGDPQFRRPSPHRRCWHLGKPRLAPGPGEESARWRMEYWAVFYPGFFQAPTSRRARSGRTCRLA